MLQRQPDNCYFISLALFSPASARISWKVMDKRVMQEPLFQLLFSVIILSSHSKPASSVDSQLFLQLRIS